MVDLEMRNTNKIQLQKRTSRQDLFRENVKHFFQNSSFHGLKFIGDSELNWFVRLFFLASFLTSTVLAIMFIQNVYANWWNKPVIITISSIPTDITEIPFPAITICNMNQVMLSKVKNFQKNSEENAVLDYLCGIEGINYSYNSTSAPINFARFLYKYAQPCRKMILNCEFAAESVDCNEIFKPVLTDEGYCCTFNVVHPSFLYRKIDPQGYYSSNYYHQDGALPIKWTPTEGYPNDLPDSYYPRSAYGTGVTMGLKIILNAEIKDYYCSTTNGHGFKVNLHSPVEQRSLRENSLILTTGTESRIRIAPLISTASNDIKDLQKQYRNCIFNEDNPLKYFAIYTRRNCELECDAELLIKNCNCVQYFSPKLESNVSACTLMDQQCIAQSLKISSSNDTECNKKCLPGCFELDFTQNSYIIPIIRGEFGLNSELIANYSNEKYNEGITALIFYYKDQTFFGKTKGEYIGMTQFLSRTGGFMALLLGFSAISIIEIFYYVTFRPFCANYRHNRHLEH